MSDIPAIELKGLTKRFGARTAVDALSLSIGQGEFFSLLGQNGAGKTTTIRMLSGLSLPTEGSADILGHDVVREADAAKALTNVSPQETAVAPRLSVRENIVLIARLYGMGEAEAEKRADALLHDFSLTDRAKDRAGKLSGGMQRRLSIAMALVSDPKVLFLDEPTLGLDVRARRDLWKHIQALKGKVTVVLTTHYLEEADALSDRIAVMDKGRLKALGTAAELEALTHTTTLEDAFLQLTDEPTESEAEA